MGHMKEVEKKSFLSLLFGSLFGGKNKLSLLEEEKVQSPFRTVVKTFSSNKIAMTALIIFILIFLTVLIGPIINPIDLSFSETSQQNVAPGYDMMAIPKSLNGKLKDIAIGPTFSAGISDDGLLYIWGKTRVSDTIDIRNLPANMGKIVDIAAGYDHLIMLNHEGKIFGSGSNRQQQITPSYQVEMLTNIKEIEAGYQSSLVLTEDGRSFYFGNTMNNDYNEFHPYQGKLKKILTTSDAVVGLTNDGQAVYLGTQRNAYSTIPENMGNVIDIATTAATVAAVNDQGQVFIWGNKSTKGEGNPPQTESKILSIQGGRYHYTAQLENGDIISWGADYYDQTDVPKVVKEKNIERFYTDFYQNYAVTDSGEEIGRAHV